MWPTLHLCLTLSFYWNENVSNLKNAINKRSFSPDCHVSIMLICTNSKKLWTHHIQCQYTYTQHVMGSASPTPTHLFLHLPPHLPPSTHHCHHPSLRHRFTSGSKPSCSTNPFYPILPFLPSGLTPSFLHGTISSEHIHFCFLVFRFSGFSFWLLYGTWSWHLSAFEHTLK